MPTGKVLIIIVTWNKKDYVLGLLDSLQKLVYPQDLLDIVVVDNASADGTVSAIRQKHPYVKIICNKENLGGTGGFNTGLRYAFSLPEGSYDYLWLLDNDVVVHQEALKHLVHALQSRPDLGACGSVMLQLDYPWRINEIGAFFDFDTGRLILNYHLAEIPPWRGNSVENLLKTPPSLRNYIPGIPEIIEVDYVAAASLLVREKVAREAGFWKDFFIHFDDVEWCLRIRRQGHGVAVCTKSLIWHLSGIAKVPTWVLYYDNRNVLEVVREHGSRAQLQKVLKRIALKPFYYALIGKPELGELIAQAIEDFQHHRWGKKDISLPWPYYPPEKAEEVFESPQIKQIAISPTVNLWATGLHDPLCKALKRRPELKVNTLFPGKQGPWFQLPRQNFVPFPAERTKKLFWILKNFKKYDLVIQSDYAPLVLLPLIAHQTMCVNDYGFSVRPTPSLKELLTLFKISLQKRYSFFYY